jgi:hypothetical protein
VKKRALNQCAFSLRDVSKNHMSAVTFNYPVHKHAATLLHFIDKVHKIEGVVGAPCLPVSFISEMIQSISIKFDKERFTLLGVYHLSPRQSTGCNSYFIT